MKLKTIYISRLMYGDNEGRYEGHITYESPLGETKLTMSPELSTKLLKVLAAEVVNSSKQLARELTTSAIEEVRALEAPIGEVDEDTIS